MNTPPSADPHFAQALQPLLLQAFDQLSNATFITEASGRIVWANQAFCRLSGYGLDELSGRTPALINSGLEGPAFYAELWQKIFSGRVWHGRVVDKKKDGSLYVADEVVTPLRDGDGSITHFVAVQQDITGRIAGDAGEQPAAYIAGEAAWPNRAGFSDLVERVISRTARNTSVAAVLRLAVALGRDAPAEDAVAAELLTVLGQRLAHTIRQSDVVSNFGGGEFAVLLTDLGNRQDAVRVVEQLESAIVSPFVHRGKAISLQGNIGIAMFPLDGSGAGTLLANADHALYQASLQGANRAQFFQPSFAHRVADHLPSSHTVQ